MITNITISEFIQDHCPIEINIETYNKATCEDPPLRAGQSTIRQYCSERYQRRFGAWTTKQKCAYISNMFLGRVYTPIIIAPVSQRDRNLDDLTTNIKFACLDGQHRSHTIAEFINNDFGFTGTIKSQKYNNVQFSKMSDTIQRHFLLKCKVGLCKIEEKNIDLAQVFIDINDGSPLNDQEKRNAINTPIAAWVRRQSDDFRAVFRQISGINYERMEDCVLISRIASMVSSMKNNSDLSNGREALNVFYQSGVNNPRFYCDKSLSYISEEFLPNLKIVAADHKSRYNSKMKNRHLFAFMVVHTKLTESNKEHSIRAELLYDFCKELIASLDSVSHSKMVEDEEKYGRNNLTMGDYFHYNTRQIRDNTKFKHFMTDILGSFDNDFDKVIKQLETIQNEEIQLSAAK